MLKADDKWVVLGWGDSGGDAQVIGGGYRWADADRVRLAAVESGFGGRVTIDDAEQWRRVTEA